MSTYQMSNVQTIELQETINTYQVRNEIYGGTLMDEKKNSRDYKKSHFWKVLGA